MKDIIILGRPRAGKSTLANKLIDKYGYQVIRLDALRDAFGKIFPKLEIAPYTAIDNDKWYEFLKEYYENIKKFSRYKYGYIIEGCDMHIKKCIELFGNDNILIYVLGQINISPEDMAKNIKKYDTQDDWTKEKEYTELVNYCSNSIKKAKQLKNECNEYKIQFFDTSENRENVIENILKIVEDKINSREETI